MSIPQAIDALKRSNFRTALDIMNSEDEAHFGLSHFLIKGLSESALKSWPAALATFATATKRFPDDALLCLNKGIAEENLGLIEDAITSYTSCLKLDPSQAEACGNLSNLYRKKLRFAEAEEMARKALELGASKAAAMNSLGLALHCQGRRDEAEETFAQAIKIEPSDPSILVNQANLATDKLNFDAAWPLFEKAQSQSPDPVLLHDEGLARLLSGDFDRGFAQFEYRLQMPNLLRLRPMCPRWNGENLQGKKLLIVAEQGFGDVIQFCRYQKLLPECELVWAVPKTLVRLLSATLKGTVLDETTNIPECDYHIHIISLAFMTSRRPLPLEAKDFSPPNIPQIPLPAGKCKRKIGLVWTGSSTHLRDRERSLPLKALDPLISATDADFYAPFIGNRLNEIGDRPIQRLDSQITDFADTASLLQQLDCLITVDTAAAHLAGALGVKTFVLLSKCPDWRWGTTDDKTVWYPSLTLIRQMEYDDWNGAVSQLMQQLSNAG